MTLQALTAQIVELKETVATLQAEMRLLRRGAGRTDGESLEVMLQHLRDSFGDVPWQSFRVFEQADDNPALYAVLVRCLGSGPTIQGLSKFLMRNLGDRGDYRLRCLKRSNAGSRFVVLQCSTATPKNASTVRGEDRRSQL